MKANLTYSLISADLKQGMYLLVNDHLGYVSRMNGDEAIISFYFEDGKVIKLAKQTMTREDAIRQVHFPQKYYAWLDCEGQHGGRGIPARG